MPDIPSPDPRERILDAAERAFAGQGLAGARVAAIAADAGVNKAMLYYYFGSKERLFDAVLGRVATAIEGLVQASFQSAELAPELRIRAFMEGYRTLILTNPTVVRVVVWDVLDGGHHLIRVASKVFQKVIPPIWQACLEGQAAGTIRRDIDSRFILPTLVAPYLLFAIASGFVGENLGLSIEAVGASFQHTALTLSLEGLLARKETP
ncbi:MAG: TetR/AcrR family transcriptional regulator [Deltaproteobacteria bacterium]|nr:TetR/AcrR family transcriptional regulator [Deltaproteobacteria bacterium]